MGKNDHVGGSDFSGKSRKRKKFVSNEANTEYRKMVDEILQVESGLSPNEIKFLDSLVDDWEGNLTEGQADWIGKIYKRVM